MDTACCEKQEGILQVLAKCFVTVQGLFISKYEQIRRNRHISWRNNMKKIHKPQENQPKNTFFLALRQSRKLRIFGYYLRFHFSFCISK